MELLFLFLAGAVQGAANFGFALISLPLLGLIMPLKTAVPLLTLVGLFLGTAQLLQIRKKPDGKMVAALLISGMAGVPLGTWFLVVADDILLKVAVGIVLVIAAVLLARGYRVRRGGLMAHCLVGGFLSGFLKGAAAIGGPPIVILLSNYDLDKEAYRSNILIYFFLIGLFAIPTYLRAGLFKAEMFNQSILGFGAAVIGLMAGNFIFKRIDEMKFKRLTYGVVMLSGLMTMASALS
jgi:hypothetical protein